MNEKFQIRQAVDELIIADEYGYPYIHINNPNNDNPRALEIAEHILKNIDLTEMIK